jgi:formate dehydrogenase iron-sulfur subunit
MRNVSPDLGKPEIRPIKWQCMHCLNPACVAACTVGALRKTPEGPVVYDSDRCIGCRYCMYACPFGIPTFEWNQTFSLIKKCDGCSPKVCQGEMPVCVKACPASALAYGTRSELLAIAKERIYAGKGKYLDKIYGERDVGGTSMLYLASVPFEQLGMPILPEESPAELNVLIMHSTPTIATTIALLLTGIYWMIKRRDRLESAQLEGTYQPVKRQED